ncbi:hypothetical protein SAMN04488109_0810 [Chryseolinea serpens]|uniref:Uncharacterized protein n=2 Tax=Chryseolinea serpens TaxID=947013 RepID=A0A1M5KSC9_9BACT|nr:hypothetical protein SAMN04488109_0810 [Chryseolinea serpens]
MTLQRPAHSPTRSRSLSMGASRSAGVPLKAFVLCALIMMTAGSLSAQQKEGIKQIDFTKSTRGYEERIRVTPDSVVVRIENFRADEKVQQSGRKLAAKEWRALLKTLKNVPFQTIPGLPSPGMQRASDAALQGTLQVTTTQQTYAHSFDNEDPNAKLVPLLKAVKALGSSIKHH